MIRFGETPNCFGSDPPGGAVQENTAQFIIFISSDYNKMEDSKEPIKIFGGTDLSNKVAMFNRKADDHTVKQKTNPFSASWDGKAKLQTVRKEDPEYGTPVRGSKTEFRGKKAGQLVSSEILTLCNMIHEFGERNEDGTAFIAFGELFQIYTRISNKVVGILLRARKHGLLNFEGEMLFQRRDDDVIISLSLPIDEIRAAAS